MKKPKMSVLTHDIFKNFEKAEGYTQRLRKYHYERAVQQVYKGKIKRIQEYKYYNEYIKK